MVQISAVRLFTPDRSDARTIGHDGLYISRLEGTKKILTAEGARIRPPLSPRHDASTLKRIVITSILELFSDLPTSKPGQVSRSRNQNRTSCGRPAGATARSARRAGRYGRPQGRVKSVPASPHSVADRCRSTRNVPWPRRGRMRWGSPNRKSDPPSRRKRRRSRRSFTASHRARPSDRPCVGLKRDDWVTKLPAQRSSRFDRKNGWVRMRHPMAKSSRSSESTLRYWRSAAPALSARRLPPQTANEQGNTFAWVAADNEVVRRVELEEK